MNEMEAVLFHEAAKKYGSVLGLSSIRALMKELGDEFQALNVIHIAGTNGKGSVCCFLASVLKEAGFLTGQFNSPAVFDLREVYQINGTWISGEEYASCMEKVAKACEKMTQKGLPHPTVFEIETALALVWFLRRKCEIVLLETGMGGATDATNVIERPLCSVFASIGMDHMDFLGDSIEKIAEIKAGIIKKNRPVISVKQEPLTEQILRKRAKEEKAVYDTAPEIKESCMKNGKLCFIYPKLGEQRLSMTGSYQAQNAALAVRTIQTLRELGFSVTDEQIKKGIETAKWSGRFERLLQKPLFYIDGAHNAEGAEELKRSLDQNFPNQKRIGIMGVMEDKPYREMIKTLKPAFEKIYTVTPDQKRALSAERLAEAWTMQGGRASAKKSVFAAVLSAYESAKEDSGDVIVLAFGSLYYLKEVKDALYQITETGN